MASRNATIVLDNNTNENWNFVSDNVEHGKFSNGNNPPSIINAHDKGQFSVTNETGALIGPKGTLTYVTDSGSDVSYTLNVSWNHPFSGATSAYGCWSTDPSNAVNAPQDPPNPSGHDQTITFTVTDA